VSDDPRVAPARGTHRIVLGMAAGVGKTYRALQELASARAAGHDAVIGYLEPHGRAVTAAQAQGLELLPRRVVSHGGMEVGELDLPGVLRRAPEIALVDELAHTNAPGLEHAKRWQDVESLLDAGIDVISTVNVQHLESLNDLVEELTGVRVRETVPDRLLTEAAEVVLVDVTPGALLDRLRAGLVYPPDRVDAALNGFFRIEHLDALRELALRQVAEGVEAKRRVPDDRGAVTDVSERLLAWVRPGPDGQAVVRRAWRSSERLGAPLKVLVTRRRVPPEREEQAAIDALSRLCGTLRVELLVREADDPVEAVAETARDQGTTYLLLAPPTRRARPLGGGRERFAAGVVEQLLEELPGVDVRLVADRAGERPPG